MVRFIAPAGNLDPAVYTQNLALIQQGKELLKASLADQRTVRERAEEDHGDGSVGLERQARTANPVPACGKLGEAELTHLPEAVRRRIAIAERQRTRYALAHPGEGIEACTDDSEHERACATAEGPADPAVKHDSGPHNEGDEYVHIYSVWPLDIGGEQASDAPENRGCPPGTTIMNFLPQSTLKSSSSISLSGPDSDEHASGRTAAMGIQRRLSNTSIPIRRTASCAIVASLCGALVAPGLLGGITPASALTVSGSAGAAASLETALDLTSQRNTVRLGEEAAFKVTGVIGDIVGDDLDARIDLKLPGSKDLIDLEDADITVAVNGEELDPDDPELDFGESSASVLVRGLSPRDTVTCDVVVSLDDDQLEGKRVRMESNLTVAGRERCDDRASVVVADNDDPVSDLQVVEEGNPEIEGGTRHLVARFSPASDVSDGTVTVGAVPDGAQLSNFTLLDAAGNEIDAADTADEGGTVFTGVSAGGDEVAAIAFELTADEEAMAAERGRIPVSVTLESASMRAPLHVSRVVDLSAVQAVAAVEDGEDDEADQDRLEAIENILAEASGAAASEADEEGSGDGAIAEGDANDGQGITALATTKDGDGATAQDGTVPAAGGRATTDGAASDGASSANKEAATSDTTFAMSFSSSTSNVKAGEKARFTLIAKPTTDSKSVELVVTPAEGITIEEGSVKASISGSSSVMPSYSVERDGSLKVTVDEVKADQRLMVEYDGTVGADQKDGAQLASKASVSVDGTESSTRDYVITVGTAAADSATEPSGNGADALQADSAAGGDSAATSNRSNNGAGNVTSTPSAASAAETAGKALGKTGIEGALILPATGTAALAGIAFCLDRFRRSGFEGEEEA